MKLLKYAKNRFKTLSNVAKIYSFKNGIFLKYLKACLLWLRPYPSHSLAPYEEIHVSTILSPVPIDAIVSYVISIKIT